MLLWLFSDHAHYLQDLQYDYKSFQSDFWKNSMLS